MILYPHSIRHSPAAVQVQFTSAEKVEFSSVSPRNIAIAIAAYPWPWSLMLLAADIGITALPGIGHQRPARHTAAVPAAAD